MSKAGVGHVHGLLVPPRVLLPSPSITLPALEALPAPPPPPPPSRPMSNVVGSPRKPPNWHPFRQRIYAVCDQAFALSLSPPLPSRSDPFRRPEPPSAMWLSHLPCICRSIAQLRFLRHIILRLRRWLNLRSLHSRGVDGAQEALEKLPDGVRRRGALLDRGDGVVGEHLAFQNTQDNDNETRAAARKFGNGSEIRGPKFAKKACVFRGRAPPARKIGQNITSS